MTVDHALVHSLAVDRVRRDDLSGIDGSATEIVQVQMVQALMDGCYDGDVTVAELDGKGDFGIGTLQGLDGELIVVDGEFWNVDFDGDAQLAPPDAKVPFAVLVDLDEADRHHVTEAMDRTAFEAWVTEQLPDRDACYALRLHGRFSRVQFRSLRHQEPPYRPLLDVIETDQKLFDRHGLEGTLVGFYFPDHAAGLNIPGFHLHLLADDRTTGGHCYTFELEGGMLEIQPVEKVHVQLPERGLADTLALDEPLRSVQRQLIRLGSATAEEIAAALPDLDAPTAQDALATLADRGYADLQSTEPDATYSPHFAPTRQRNLPRALDDL